LAILASQEITQTSIAYPFPQTAIAYPSKIKTMQSPKFHLILDLHQLFAGMRGEYGECELLKYFVLPK